MPRTRRTAEDFVALGREARERAGRPIACREFCDATGVSDATIRTRFGSWAAFSQRFQGAPDRPTAAREAKAAAAPKTFHRSERDRREIEGARRLVVTSAVSNADVDPGFLAALLHLCDDRQARLVVNPVRYKNPQRREEAARFAREERWAPELEPYMLEGEIRPHHQLVLRSTKIQATRANPLPRSMWATTKGASAILGHPQLAMRCVPTPHRKLPGQLYTSGAVTRKDYSDTEAGDRAHFHHSLAAVLVEICGERFHLREVTWSPRDQAFIDLGDMYRASGREDAPRPLELITGDTHVPRQCPVVHRATFGPGGIVERYGPEGVVLHDVGDFPSCNVHERGKALTAAARAARGYCSTVTADIRAIGAYIEGLPAGLNVTVARSNHDDFLMRWLERGQPEHENAKLYHGLAYLMLDARERGEAFPNPLALALQGSLRRPVRWLDWDESYRRGDVELGMHGHLGPNGARGSVENLATIGTRSVIGHVHTPAIHQGVYAVGLSGTYDQGYNHGPSSWLQAHVLLNALGYRQMLAIIDGHHMGS